MWVAPEIIAAALGGAGTAGLVMARVYQRTEQTYRLLVGYEEREDDGLIDQVEETHQLAQTNRRALRKEGIFPTHDRD